MISIVTGANAKYLDQIKPYLETLNENAAGLNPTLCCVDCEPPGYLEGLPEVKAVRLDRSALAGSPDYSDSLQHGAWLDVVPGNPDEVVIWTDGDLYMQRPMSDPEREGLAEWPENSIGVSWNMGPDESLLIEALYKLRPKVSDGAFLDRWGRETITKPVFNVGLMVARRSTFSRLHDIYLPLWDEIGEYLDHPARQQWLLSYLICTQGFDIRVLPYTFHTHAHFDLPSGTLVARDGTAYHGTDVILFWHLPMWLRK